MNFGHSTMKVHERFHELNLHDTCTANRYEALHNQFDKHLNCHRRQAVIPMNIVYSVFCSEMCIR